MQPLRFWLSFQYLAMNVTFESMITTVEAMEMINSSTVDDSISIQFLKFDRQRGIDGGIKSMADCYVVGSSHGKMVGGSFAVNNGQSVHPVAVHVGLLFKLDNEMVGWIGYL